MLARIGPVALGIVSAAWLSLVWIWPPAYLTLTTDDSFYYLETATNIASGRGSTFDQVSITNGYHPLWMLLLVPVARLAGHDPALLARSALTLGILLVLVASLLFDRLSAARGRGFCGLFAIALYNFYCAKILVNGMESAVHFAALTASLAAFARLDAARYASVRGWAALGLLGGVVTLARLDAVIFAALLISVPLVWPHPGVSMPWRARLTCCGYACMSWLSVVAPYFAWSWHATGHLLPVSAAIKSGLPDTFWPLSALTASVALAALISLRVGAGLLQARAAEKVRWLAPLAGYVAVELALATWRGSLAEIWTFPPHLLLALTSLAMIARWSRRLLHAFALLVFIVLTLGSWWYRLQPESYERYARATDIGRWLDENVPGGSLVAGWDVGVVAAHTSHRVVELGGLINSWDYKERYLARGLTEEFLRDAGIDHLVQYFPTGSLRGPHPSWRGVDLEAWHAVRADCFRMRSFADLGAAREIAYVVLRRGPGLVATCEPAHAN